MRRPEIRASTATSQFELLRPRGPRIVRDYEPNRDRVSILPRIMFDVDAAGFVTAWTDGACTANGREQAMAAIGVYFGPGHPLNIARRLSGRQTNNAAEIQAVTEAARAVYLYSAAPNLRVFTDSKFVIHAYHHWIPGWDRAGWKTPRGRDIVCEQDLREMAAALRRFDRVKLEYFPGHRGDAGNESANRLAQAAARVLG